MIEFCRQNLVKIVKVDQIIRLFLKLITLDSIPESTHMILGVLKIPLFSPVVLMAGMQKMACILWALWAERNVLIHYCDSFLYFAEHYTCNNRVLKINRIVCCFAQVRESWNLQLDARVAHILNVTFLTLTLHFMDRQVSYLRVWEWKYLLTNWY